MSVKKATEGGLEIWPNLVGSPVRYTYMLGVKVGEDYIAVGCGSDGTAYNSRMWLINIRDKSSKEMPSFIGQSTTGGGYGPLAYVNGDVITSAGTLLETPWFWVALNVLSNTRRNIASPPQRTAGNYHLPTRDNEVFVPGGTSGGDEGPAIVKCSSLKPCP